MRLTPFATTLAAGLIACLVGMPITKAASDDNFKPTAQDEIVPAGAKVEMLWDKGEFTEGPAPAADGAILFSDIGNRIMRFDPRSEQTTVFRDPSGKANGLKFNPEGRLIACEGAAPGGNRRHVAHRIRRNRPHAGRSLRRQAVQQPQRPGHHHNRQHLLHRSALRGRRAARARLRGRVPCQPARRR